MAKQCGPAVMLAKVSVVEPPRPCAGNLGLPEFLKLLSAEIQVTGTWSTGCLCDLHPDYAPLNKWNHGFAFVEVFNGGKFEVQNLFISDGKVYSPTSSAIPALPRQGLSSSQASAHGRLGVCVRRRIVASGRPWLVFQGLRRRGFSCSQPPAVQVRLQIESPVPHVKLSCGPEVAHEIPILLLQRAPKRMAKRFVKLRFVIVS